MSLSAEELDRYARHIVLRHVGGPGQQKIKAANVLVLGAGGLGSPVLQYLAAAGVGKLTIVDDDIVSRSNLQRQVIHRTEDIARPKAQSAAEAIQRLNPHVGIVPLRMRLTAENAGAALQGQHVAVDCSDNFAARYALTDSACALRIPVVTAAVNEFDATITTLRPFEADPSGVPNPTYRCLYPEAPPAEMIPACSEAGVMGALLGVVGALQAVEVLRQIVGFGEGLVGKLLMVDALTMRFETMAYGWDPENVLTGSGKST
jgi:adenylyltransferase/sulfurtransferase